MSCFFLFFTRSNRVSRLKLSSVCTAQSQLFSLLHLGYITCHHSLLVLAWPALTAVYHHICEKGMDKAFGTSLSLPLHCQRRWEGGWGGLIIIPSFCLVQLYMGPTFLSLSLSLQDALNASGALCRPSVANGNEMEMDMSNKRLWSHG